MPDEIAAFGDREQRERGGHHGAHVVERPWARGPQEGFQFGKGEFDRIEVGTVRREKAEVGANSLERGADRGVFVHREIVEDHDIAWS